jgi:hypothetical protein
MSSSPASTKRIKKEVIPFTIPEPIKKKQVNKSKVAIVGNLGKKEVKELNDLQKQHRDKLKILKQEKQELEDKILLASLKFPMKDELIAIKDPKRPMAPIPPPKGFISLPPELLSDAVSVWEFVNTFSKQLVICDISIDDFVELLKYTNKPSVALTEIFSSLVRMLLLDPNIAMHLNNSIEKKNNFCLKINSKSVHLRSNEVNGTKNATTDDNYDNEFCGIGLLPARLSVGSIDGLKWSLVIRAIILMLPSVKKLYKTANDAKALLSLVVSSNSAQEINDFAATGLTVKNKWNKDVLLKLTSDVDGTLVTLKDAALALETKEMHELSASQKLAILKVLVDECYTTEELTKLLHHNATERSEKMAEMKKIDKELKEKRKLQSQSKRDAAIEKCRLINMKHITVKEKRVRKPKEGSAPNPNARPKSKNADDPYYPKQDQINEMLEEMVLMEELGIDEIIDELPVEGVSDDENEDDENEDDDEFSRRPAEKRNKAVAKAKMNHERRSKLNLIQIANEALKNAIEIGSEKDIKKALRLGQSHGLQGENDDGDIFCTKLMFQAYKVQKNIAEKSEEEQRNQEHEKALEEYKIGSTSLGMDRDFRTYWMFTSDDRLFVQQRVVGSDKTVLSEEEESVIKSLIAVNPHLERLYNSRPNKYKYIWGSYSVRELWDLCEALDERGIRERELKNIIKAKFNLTEPPIVYLTTGSQYIGRQVKRTFGKRKVIGTITGWLPPDGDDIALWHVEHVDGDEEDLEEFEVEKYILAVDDPESIAASEKRAAKLEKEKKVIVKPNSKQNLSANQLNSSSSSQLLVQHQSQVTDELDYEPEIISSTFTNTNRYYKPVGSHQIGLNGFKSELTRILNLCNEGFKSKKNEWSRDLRKTWEKNVYDAESPHDLKNALIQLEEVIHSLQQCDDKDDFQEYNLEKEKNRQLMIEEGWIFDPKELPDQDYIGKRVRRFFYGVPPSNGTIVAFLQSNKSGDETLWCIEHDDGDVEDVDENDLIKAIRAYDDDILEVDDPEGFQNYDVDDEVMNDDEDIPKPEDLDVFLADIPVDGTFATTLWPTAGVRQKWLEYVTKLNTIGELSFALTSLYEFSKCFGVAINDPLDSASSRPKGSLYSSFGFDRKRSKCLSPSKKNSKTSKNGKFDEDYDNRNPTRSTRNRSVNYSDV